MPPQARLGTVIASVFLASAWTPPAVFPQERSTRTVLAIHWGSEDYPTAPIVNGTIQQTLNSDPTVQIDYFVEYLESDIFPAETASLALGDYIGQKYRDRHIDVVIAIADPALEFVLERRELFPDAAIVFSGLTLPETVSRSAAGGLAAVMRGIAYGETLKLALALHPSTEQVFVVARRPDHQVVNSVQAELRGFAQRIPLTYLDEKTVPRLLDAVKAIPPRSLILYIWFTEDPPGPYKYVDEQVARLVAEAAPVPVYGTHERYIGTGVVGGVVRGIRETAARVAEMTREILHGKRAEDMPIENVRLVPVFDWRQLQRRDIKLSRIPPGSDVRFRTPTPWETYREYIIATVIIVSAQLLLIAGLLVQRTRRRRAEDTIRVREAALRTSYERSRQLAGKLINAQERTRASIARDLHDGVCQELAAVSIGVDLLKRASGHIQEPQIQEALSNLQEDTWRASDGIRRLSHDLHPTTLGLLGLADALKAQCAEIEKRHRVQVRWSADGEFGDVEPDIALCLFRIAQEALRNAVMHGDAKRLAVSLARSDEQIDLTVTDDGRGFDLEAVRRSGGGLGLVSIEERVRMVGAAVQIVSGVQEGTTIRVRSPAHAETASTLEMDSLDAAEP